MIEKNYYHFNSNNYNDDFILSQNTIIPKDITKYLKTFQLAAIKFLYKNFETHKACILNDESGLGKTASVAVFLNVILSNNNDKRKCLIICKNEERINNWKFHLDILTDLAFKVAFNENEIDDHTVYLTKWESLRSSASLANYKFDCIIVDNRENLMANKICLAYLLRNYENKISLVIANQDVTIDLKEFHSILRLCGRLETKYRDFKVFEDKFELPLVQGCSSDNQKILESYFLRREKILNYCKEFCLRRFRHQYESQLPLVSPSVYRLNFKKWEDAPTIAKIKPVQLNVFSLNQRASCYERDTEEIHSSFINKINQDDDLSSSFFTRKEEDEFNIEVCRITTTITDNAVEQSTEVMSPLVFIPDDSNESHFEYDDNIDELVSSTTKDESEVRIIHPAPIHISVVSEPSGPTSKPKGRKRSVKEKAESVTTDDDLEIVRVTRLTPRTRKDKNLRSGYKKLKISRVSTRAQDRVTRSQAHKNKYLTLSIEDTLEKSKRDLEEIKKQKKNINKPTENKNVSNVNKVKTKSPSKNLKENNKNSNKDENVVSTSCNTINSNDLDYSLLLDPNFETTLTSSDSTIAIPKKKTKKTMRSQNELQLSGLSLLDVQHSEAVHIVESTPELIVLSSSSDSSIRFDKNKTTNPFKKINLEKISSKLNKTTGSPDIFGSAIDETLHMICSQKSKHTQNKKIRKSKSPIDYRNIEITDKNIRIRTNSNNIAQNNKITKYLKSDSAQDSEKEIVSSSSQSIQASPILTCPKTPKKKKIVKKNKNDSREGSATKPSPHTKNSSSGTTPTKTPTALTKWLYKSNINSREINSPKNTNKNNLDKDEEVITSSRVTRSLAVKNRRRKLDLSFEK